MDSLVNGVLQSVILQPIIVIMNYLGKLLTILLRLDFSYIFSSKAISNFLFLFIGVVLICMLALYVIGLVKVKQNNQSQPHLNKAEISKRFFIGIVGIFATPLVLIGIFALGAILKGFGGLLGYKEVTFVSSLYTFANLNGGKDFINFLNANNITTNLTEANTNLPIIINPTGKGAYLMSQTTTPYVELNQAVVNALLTTSDQGMKMISYNYIIIPIFIGVAMLFVLLPLIVSVVSRIFSMTINYIILYITLAINILKPNVYQQQIQKIFSDVVILTTYSILFYLVSIIQNTISQVIINSNVVDIVGALGLNLMVGLVIFTGTTIASLWPTWVAQTLFKDDQLLSQISNTNRNLWSRSSNAFRTSGLIISTGIGSVSKLFKPGTKNSR